MEGDSEPPRYRECLRNHAARLGGHVVDGCGEFMPDSADAMKCAACGCHRSFHRKETDGTDDHAIPISDSYHPNRVLRLLPPPHLRHHHHSQRELTTTFGANASRSGGGTTTESSSEERNAGVPMQAEVRTSGMVPKKRFRTKFTAEQKQRMLGFAESVGWRVLKQDEAVTERFCAEIGITRQVLKVWMHNNKHSIKKQPQEP